MNMKKTARFKLLLIFSACCVVLASNPLHNGGEGTAGGSIGAHFSEPVEYNLHNVTLNPTGSLLSAVSSRDKGSVLGVADKKKSLRFTAFKHTFDIIRGAAFLFYGLALVLYGENFDHQVHFLVMMRVTGFQSVKQGVGVLSECIFHTHRQVKKEFPVLKKAQADLAAARMEVDKLKAAEAKLKDTEMSSETWRIIEARKILYARNAEALDEATESLEKIVEATQADAIWEVLEGFFGMTTAVMATGHHVEYVSRAIGLVCHVGNFVMMGNTLLEQLHVRGPIATVLHHLLFGNDEQLIPQKARGTYKRVETALDKVLCWGAVTAFWVWANRPARRLHLSLLGAFVTLTGARWLLQGLSPGRHDSGIAQALRKRPGALVVLAVALLGYVGRPHFQGKAAWVVDHFLFAPLVYLEDAVDELVHLAEMLE
mmetsp:Transcript_35856/g.52429  ORF Transcript_35856/g.52429 Transcript_35856/m.52429 type:complete len:428 (-) Transcript_35856:409-1692(-)